MVLLITSLIIGSYGIYSYFPKRFEVGDCFYQSDVESRFKVTKGPYRSLSIKTGNYFFGPMEIQAEKINLGKEVVTEKEVFLFDQDMKSLHSASCN